MILTEEKINLFYLFISFPVGGLLSSSQLNYIPFLWLSCLQLYIEQFVLFIAFENAGLLF